MQNSKHVRIAILIEWSVSRFEKAVIFFLGLFLWLVSGFRASCQKCGVNYIWGGLAEVESFLGEMQWTGLFLFLYFFFFHGGTKRAEGLS